MATTRGTSGKGIDAVRHTRQSVPGDITRFGSFFRPVLFSYPSIFHCQKLAMQHRFQPLTYTVNPRELCLYAVGGASGQETRPTRQSLYVALTSYPPSSSVQWAQTTLNTRATFATSMRMIHRLLRCLPSASFLPRYVSSDKDSFMRRVPVHTVTFVLLLLNPAGRTGAGDGRPSRLYFQPDDASSW